MKTAKHLQNMSPENLQALQTGFNRFRFGFAVQGETLEQNGYTFTFLGDFGVKKEAEEVAKNNKSTAVHGYLNGKRARGWTVYQKITKVCVISADFSEDEIESGAFEQFKKELETATGLPSKEGQASDGKIEYWFDVPANDAESLVDKLNLLDDTGLAHFRDAQGNLYPRI